MGTAIKHPMPDQVKSSFVIFDIRALWRSGLSARPWAPECPDVKNYKWRLNPVWQRILYSCTHMSTVGVKGLKVDTITDYANDQMEPTLSVSAELKLITAEFFSTSMTSMGTSLYNRRITSPNSAVNRLDYCNSLQQCTSNCATTSELSGFSCCFTCIQSDLNN